MWAAFLVEMLTTALFLSVVLAVTDKRNEHAVSAPIAIGLSLAGIHFATIGLTGTSVNPARSIGVGVFAGTDAILQLWLFILAPLLGAAIAGLAHPLVFGRDAAPVAGSGLSFSAPAPVGYAGGWQPQQYRARGPDHRTSSSGTGAVGPPQQQCGARTGPAGTRHGSGSGTRPAAGPWTDESTEPPDSRTQIRPPDGT